MSVSMRFSGRTGGPAVRRPSLLYWPPWHGHANADPFSSTGQPRCMQVFAITRYEVSDSFLTKATRRSLCPFGPRSYRTVWNLSVKVSVGPRSVQYQSSPENDGPRAKPMIGTVTAAPIN